MDAQVRGGRNPTGLKDAGDFSPAAPSCALLFRPCRLPDTCSAFLPSGSVALSHSSRAGISARCRSFAPSWAVCTNPPFSPTAAPVPVTIVLSPTRKSTQKRHWQQPLVEGVQEITDAEFLKWWPDYGYTERTYLVAAVLYTLLPRLSSSPTDLTFDQTTSPGGFFVYRAEDYARKKRISRRSFFIRYKHRLFH